MLRNPVLPVVMVRKLTTVWSQVGAEGQVGTHLVPPGAGLAAGHSPPR